MRLTLDRSSDLSRSVYVHFHALCFSDPKLAPDVEVDVKLTSVNGHAGYLYRNAARGLHAWVYYTPSEDALVVLMGDRTQVKYDEHLRSQPTEKCIKRIDRIFDVSLIAQLLARYLSTGNPA